MRHPFRGTPQYEQVYGNRYGPPLGRPGNGLGDVWGGLGNPESVTLGRRPRPNDSIPEDLYAAPNEVAEGERGLDEEEINLLHESIGQLTARQAFVIRLRYGLTSDGEGYTLEEIGSFMGVTKQAVSDIEQRALIALTKLVAGG